MKNLNVTTIPVTPLQQNCSLLTVTGGSDAVLVDPGGDVSLIAQIVKKRNLNVAAIWLTHSHFDHCGGVAEALALWPKAQFLAHPNEGEFRARAAEVALMWGLQGCSNCPEPTVTIRGGERLSVGGISAEGAECTVLFVPGHSPGHVAFYFEQDKVLIAGDTVFNGSIGRTDLPFGNHDELIASIKREILTLPNDVVVFPGHGPSTTVGVERMSNPFLA